jgi:hypothetical protein
VDLDKGSRKSVIKREYFFRPDCLPPNFKQVQGISKDEEIRDRE